MSAAASPVTSTPSGLGRALEAHRLFLIVVDDSEELPAAIHYACTRARQTGGRVALLYVYQIDHDFHHWKFVTGLVEQEAQQEADNVLKLHTLRVVQETGRRPETYVRKGNRREELFKLVKEHPEISILVLSAAAGRKPGPLVEAVTGKFAGKIGIPVTVVPEAIATAAREGGIMSNVTRRDMFAAGALGAIAAVGLLGNTKPAAAAELTPTEQTNVDMVNAFCKSWGDKATTVAQIMSHMTDDTSFKINGQAPTVGRTAVTALFETFFKGGTRYEMITHETFAKGPVVINTRTDTTLKTTGRDKPSAIVGIFIFKDGKIQEWEEVIYKA